MSTKASKANDPHAKADAHKAEADKASSSKPSRKQSHDVPNSPGVEYFDNSTVGLVEVFKGSDVMFHRAGDDGHLIPIPSHEFAVRFDKVTKSKKTWVTDHEEVEIETESGVKTTLGKPGKDASLAGGTAETSPANS